MEVQDSGTFEIIVPCILAIIIERKVRALVPGIIIAVGVCELVVLPVLELVHRNVGRHVQQVVIHAS